MFELHVLGLQARWSLLSGYLEHFARYLVSYSEEYRFCNNVNYALADFMDLQGAYKQFCIRYSVWILNYSGWILVYFIIQLLILSAGHCDGNQLVY